MFPKWVSDTIQSCVWIRSSRGSFEVFVIDLDSERDSVDRVSYSYIDVLTGSVELKFN